MSKRRSIDKTGRRSEKYDMAMSYMSESRIREEEDFRRAGMAIQREARRKVREQEGRATVPPAVPAAAIIITVFFLATDAGTQPESAGVCGGWCGRCIRQGHGRGDGGSICCAAGG